MIFIKDMYLYFFFVALLGLCIKVMKSRDFFENGVKSFALHLHTRDFV